MPALKEELLTVIHRWGAAVGCRQSRIFRVQQMADMTPEEAVSHFDWHILSRGDRSGEEYPRLRGLLETVRRSGPEAGPPYLMTVMNRLFIDMSRRCLREQEHTGHLPRAMNLDNSIHAEDAPGDQPDPSAVNPLEATLRHQALERFLPSLGDEFLTSLVLLAREWGVGRDEVAQSLSDGRQLTLARELVQLISHEAGHSYADAFHPLLEAARDYILPERFRRDHKALVAHLYRRPAPQPTGGMSGGWVNAIYDSCFTRICRPSPGGSPPTLTTQMKKRRNPHDHQ